MNPETPDYKRLFMAVFLMTALLMAYNAFFAPKPLVLDEIKAAELIQDKQPEKAAKKLAPVKKAPMQEADKQAIVTKTLSHIAKNTTIARDTYQVTFSSEGARIQDFTLTGFQNPVLLPPNLAVESRDSNLTLSEKTRYKLVKQDSNQIVFEKLTPENIKVSRTYKFSNKAFVIDSELILKNQSPHAQALSLNFILKTRESDKPEEEQLAVSIKSGEELLRIPYSDIAEKAQEIKGDIRYVGFDRRYFFMSLNLSGEAAYATSFTEGDTKSLQIKLEQKTVLLQPGQTHRFVLSSYIGPKELALLKSAGHNLEENIDYGWFGVLSRPLLWLLVWINQWVANFGLAIILLTIFIKLLTFPLTQKSFMAQQEMKKIQPELKALQKKYAHDKAKLGQEQMAFYKEKGINPMAGCLPILIQMPVWFALYQMLGNSVELYEQPFYSWITNLTQPDPYYVLPVSMGISMLISQLILSPPVDESQPQMKYVMWFMPIFLTFIMLTLPAGLSLYMLVNNLLTIAQQAYVKYRYGI